MRIGRIMSFAFLIAVAMYWRAIADEATTRPVAHVNHAGLVKLGWQLAGETSTFHDRADSETIDLFHSLGFHHLEISPGLTTEDIEPLLAKLKSVHMDIVSYGVVGTAGIESDLRKLFDLAKKLKVKNIVVDPADDSLDILDKLGSEYRINVAIVNLPKPGNHWNPDDELRLLTGRSGRIGLCADVAAWTKSGLSPSECIHKLAGHIVEIRLNDIDNRSSASAALGELKSQGFKGICALGCATGSGDELVDRFTLSVNTFSDIVGELARTR